MKLLQFPSFLLVVLLLPVFLGHNSWQVDGMRCLETERQALLQFKHQIVYDYGRLSSWADQTDCCRWTGVHCHNETNHVTGLDLHNPYADGYNPNYTPLGGTISSSILELHNLQYLNLSWNDFGYHDPIPEFLGSLTKLRYLDLRSNLFRGPIPHQLGNLSELLHLNIGSNRGCYSKSLDWISNLQSLEYLDLSTVNLSETPNWLQSITTLSSIKELHLTRALPEISPFVLPAINRSAPLSVLDLSYNHHISSSSLLMYVRWFSDFSSTGLTSIDLSDCGMQGGIPRFFGNMSSLVHLDLSSNDLTEEFSELMMNLSGPIERTLQHLDLGGNSISGLFSNISKFSSLIELRLSRNQLNGSIREDYLQLPSLVELYLSSNQLTGPLQLQLLNLVWLDLRNNQLTGPLHLRLPNLVEVDLSSNRLTGSVPDLSFSSSLKRLYLHNNTFNGTLTESTGHLSKLEELFIGSNRLEGTITEAHMLRLSRLQYLDLSFNPLLEVKPSHDWFPPFQLQYLLLSHCKLGPSFPMWLKTQKQIAYIDISNTGISDTIPGWLVGTSPELYYLNASNNQMYGNFPNFEALSGKLLDLSSNKISGSMTFLCHTRNWVLLDLSNNQLSDQIPGCFANFEMLEYLNLANNNLSGEIPFLFGSLTALSLLHLRNNSFSGELPMSMRNCTSLRMVDLGGNRLTGKLPTWIGDSFSKLKVLILRSNEFYGSIPSNLCGLANLQILDISSNNISEAIPECVHDFIAMTEKENDDLFSDEGEVSLNDIESYVADIKSFNSPYFMWKGMEVKYTNNVILVKLIDLSSNNLSGQIPSGITKLIGLVALNLSRNNLVGPIPGNIGELKSLDSLDFSRNHLSGRIPPSLGELGYLGVLNLSYNNLSGRIPPINKLQTFEEAYMGNPDLCGLPLNKSCPGDKESHQDVNNSTSKVEEFEDEDKLITEGFYVSLAVGFVVAFWAVFGTILFNRASRHAFFMALDTTADFVYVRMQLSKTRLLRYFKGD